MVARFTAMARPGAVPAEIAARIVLIRGRRALLDADLAAMYGVETRVLLQAVRRNHDRFPADFMISLTRQDLAALRSQSVISKSQGSGGRRHAIQAFTEHGAVMAATILNSPRAIAISLLVVRVFVQLRESLSQSEELGRRFRELETRLEQRLGAQDQAIAEILDAIRQLMAPPERPQRRPIGFVR
jgi:ORF6N domain